MDQQAEKDKTERATGLGRREREEIAKWNQTTALRFQTGGRHQTSQTSLWGNTKVVCELFADDNSIHLCGTDVEPSQCSLQEGLNDVSKWCHKNSMVIHPGKTKSMVLASRQKHLRKCLMLKLILGANLTEQVGEHKVIGVTVDEELKHQSHVGSACKQLARNLFLFCQLKHCVAKCSLKPNH